MLRVLWFSGLLLVVGFGGWSALMWVYNVDFAEVGLRTWLLWFSLQVLWFVILVRLRVVCLGCGLRVGWFGCVLCLPGLTCFV